MLQTEASVSLFCFIILMNKIRLWGIFHWLTDTEEFCFFFFFNIFVCTYIISGEGNGTPLQYSCLENPMDEEAWWVTVHGVTKSRTWLSGFTFTFHFHALEKEMAAHSSVLAWRIPGTGEPGGLPSMGSHRVGHDWSNVVAAAAYNKSKEWVFQANWSKTSYTTFNFHMLIFNLCYIKCALYKK